MNTFTQNKLISVSRTTLTLLRVLFALLIFMTIIPWVFPTSSMGRFLISLYSIIHLMEPQNVDYFLQHISVLSWFFGVTGSFVSLCPLLIGVFIMMKLSKNYMSGHVFNLFNAKAYRNLGWIYLLSALLLQPLAQVFFSLSISFIHHHLGQRFITISIDVNNLSQIFFALVLVLIGHVMQLAQKINEEQELTV